MADLVAKEKNLDRDSVLRALEEGIATAIRKNFPQGVEISVEIDPKTNSIGAWRKFALAEKIEDFETQITKTEAEKDLQEHDWLTQDAFYQEISFQLTRQQFNITKQVALQKLKTEIKENMLEKLNEREEGLLSGTVKLVKKDALVVETASLEIIVPKSSLMPRDRFKINDRIYFVIEKVVRGAHSTTIYGSRRSNEFLVEVLKREINLIQDGVIEIKTISRIPGYSSKVVLHSLDANVDPIRASVGPRGQFIKNVNQFMFGEGIDLIKWSDDEAEFFINCMQPVKPLKISIDEQNKTIDAVVEAEDEALTKKDTYRQHLNQLTGWTANFYTADEWDNKEESQSTRAVDMFMRTLDVDADIATSLFNLGFVRLEEIAYVPASEFVGEELDEDTVNEIKSRAVDYLASLENDQEAKGIYELFGLGLDFTAIETLRGQKVANIQDLADLDRFELQEMLPDLSDDKANKLIMSARA